MGPESIITQGSVSTCKTPFCPPVQPTDRTLGWRLQPRHRSDLCWGFWINWWMVGNIPVESLRSIHPWLFVGGYFASCLTGAWLFHSLTSPG